MKSSSGTALLFAAVPAMFASNMVIARWFDGAIPPLTLAMLRWIIAGLVLLAIERKRISEISIFRGKWPLLAALTLLGGVLSVGPQYMAATYTQAGHIALIFAISPLMVCFIEWAVCGRPVGAMTVLGAALAFLGIALVVSGGDPANLLAMRCNRGDLLALVASTAWAGYTALSKRRPTGLPGMVPLAVLALGSGVMLLPASALELASGAAVTLNAETCAGVLALALIAGVGAYFAYGLLIERLGAPKAAMSMYLIPLWALAMGAVFLGEEIRPWHMLAAAMVLSGLGLSNLSWHPGRLSLFHPRRTALRETGI